MKGLITKDLLGLRQVALTMGLLMVFYIFLGFMNMKDSGGMMYFSIMALVINIMVPLSCAGYDEQCGWDQFGASLPVSKNQIVLCRYIVCLIVIGFSTAVMLVGNLIFAVLGGSPSGVMGYLFPIIASMIYIAVMNPIIYKFGVQKSRIIVMAVFLIPSMLVAGISMLIANNASEDSTQFFDALDKIPSVSPAQIIGVGIGLTAAAAVIYVLSMLLSMKIYGRKEL